MIIRGEKISGHLLLSENRELIALQEGEQKIHSLFEQEYQKAFENGKSAGFKEGKTQAQDSLAGLHSLMQTVAHRLLEQKQQLMHQLKPEVVEFALQASMAVLKRELKEKETLIHLIHHVLNKASHYEISEKWHLFLSPEDLVQLEEALEQQLHHSGKVALHPDPALPRGDFRLEGEKTLLRFSLEREVEQLKQQVQNAQELCLN